MRAVMVFKVVQEIPEILATEENKAALVEELREMVNFAENQGQHSEMISIEWED